MNAIVFVVMPAHDSQPLPEREAALSVLDRTKVDLPRTADSDQTTPPLWTWFIENPRPFGA